MRRNGCRRVIFVEDVCARFEDLNHEDIIPDFDKLQQEDSASDYQDRFEELRASMITLTEDYIFSIPRV